MSHFDTSSSHKSNKVIPMNTSELLAHCVDLMNEHGVDSRKVIDFIQRNLVQISRVLKRVLDKDVAWEQELRRLRTMIKPGPDKKPYVPYSGPTFTISPENEWDAELDADIARLEAHDARDLRADWEEMAPDLILEPEFSDGPEHDGWLERNTPLKTWRITQIIYLGSGQRHTDYWYVQTRREPTKAEVRARWGIKRDDAIVISQAPPVRVWDLP